MKRVLKQIKKNLQVWLLAWAMATCSLGIINASQLTPIIVPSPTIYPNGGEFASSVSISISIPPEFNFPTGTNIYYTTDGTDPSTTNGILYKSPFILNTSASVKAAIEDVIKYQSGNKLAISRADFNISKPSDAQYKVLHYFKGSDGDWPIGSMIRYNNILFGVTASGGVNGAGEIFSMNTDGSDFKVIYSFNGVDGSGWGASLVLADTKIYGTMGSGWYNGGSIFSVKSDGSNFQILHTFSNVEGKCSNKLIVNGNQIIGKTAEGGTNNFGAIFSLRTDGSDFHALYNFTDSVRSSGELTLLIGNTLYGMSYGTSYADGPNDYGSIFSINTDGTNFTVLHHFTGSDGAYPVGDLIVNGSSLYGITTKGGANNHGEIFSLNLDGANFRIIHNFGNADGSYPQSSLLLMGSKFYGTTSSDGVFGMGTIFSIGMDGSNLAVLHNFIVDNGKIPQTLIAGNSSELFGVASFGGNYDHGTIFSLSPPLTPVYSWSNFAGQPGGAGNADGTGNAARFGKPFGLTMDRNGNLYIADADNHTIRKMTSSGVVTTLAGSAGRQGHDDGVGVAASFNCPYGIAVDVAGNVYVADTANYTIRKITPTGTVTTLAGNAGYSKIIDGTGVTANFQWPRGIAIGNDGNLYVADASTIRKVTSTGVVTTIAGCTWSSGSVDGIGSEARFSAPDGLIVDGSGNLYVTDPGNYTIRKVTVDGTVTTLAGSAGNQGADDGTGSSARFTNPFSIAIDNSGNLYVGDGNRIRVVTSLGEVTTLPLFNENFYFGGIAIDDANNLFVTDPFNNRIWRRTSAGIAAVIAGEADRSGDLDGTNSAAQFRKPEGVAVDSAGNLYVADICNNTIRMVTPAGNVTTIAGQPLVSGSADGINNSARFYSPTGLALDRDSNIYVADSGNHTIRKITHAENWNVTTFAGKPGNRGYADGTGDSAQFNTPRGIAVDSTGNLYVADCENSVIRKITSERVVTTLAGNVNAIPMNGNIDGTGSEARFYNPIGIAVDNNGCVYVADTYNNRIRKITPEGVVTTVVGKYWGSKDGTATSAQFFQPYGVTVDSNGNLYVADTSNHTIRKMSTDGIVATIGNIAGVIGGADGMASLAQFSSPMAITVDFQGNLYVADTQNNRISKGSQTYAPVIDVNGLLSVGTIGLTYHQTLKAIYGSTPYLWSIVSGSLPSGLTLDANNAIISGTPTEAGAFSFRIRVTDKNTLFAEKDFNLFVQTRYQIWQTSFFTPAQLANPNIIADTADPAADGVSNLMKYALGLNPTIPALSVNQPSVGISQDSQHLQIIFMENADATDIIYLIQASDDCKQWETIASWSWQWLDLGNEKQLTKVYGYPVFSKGATVTENPTSTPGLNQVIAIDNELIQDHNKRFLRLK